MKTFDYHKPNSVPEAVALLANRSEESAHCRRHDAAADD